MSCMAWGQIFIYRVQPCSCLCVLLQAEKMFCGLINMLYNIAIFFLAMGRRCVFSKIKRSFAFCETLLYPDGDFQGEHRDAPLESPRPNLSFGGGRAN